MSPSTVQIRAWDELPVPLLYVRAITLAVVLSSRRRNERASR